MTDSTLFILFSTGGLILLVGMFRLFSYNITRHWKKHQAQSVDLWKAEGVEFILGPSGCQFGGLESTGAIRIIQGVGYAALSDQDLRLTRATPVAIHIISHKQIKGLTIQPTFLGNKSKKVPYLVIRFKQAGEADKIAFRVKDYEAWVTAIATAAKVRVKDLRAET